MTEAELRKALLDPGAVFGSPEQLLERSDLGSAQKRDLLTRWLYDARELSVAEEEGMAGGEPSLIERIAAALNRLANTEEQATRLQ